MPRTNTLGRIYDLDDDALSDEEDERARKSKVTKRSTTGNPMDAEINGTPFSVLMQQAVKMKTAQTAVDKVKFEKWPRFYQNSVFAKPEVVAARGADFPDRIEFAIKMKDAGNDFLKQGGYLDANHAYEQALAVFKWAENTDPDFKNKGIKDESLVEHEYSPSDDQEAEILSNFKKSCYLNLGLCAQKTGEHSVAIQACTSALEIDPDNAKALYRRAMSRIAPKSSGGLEMDQALQDLVTAAKSAPEDITISKTLKRLLAEKKKQAKADKRTFSGMFKRGEVYTDLDEEKVKGDLDRDHSADPEDTIERRLYEAEQLYGLYVRQGKTEEADDLRQKIEMTKKAKKSMEEREARKSVYGNEPNFRNPTEKMIEDARERGIDLTDERVVEMLEGLKEEKKRGINQDSEESTAKKGLKGTKWESDTKEKLTELVGDMSKDDLSGVLKEMDEDGEGERDVLVDRFVAALMAGKKIPENFNGTGGARPWWMTMILQFFGGGSTSIWGNLRIGFMFAFLSLMWKMFMGGRRKDWVMKQRLEVVDEQGFAEDLGFDEY